MTKSPIIGWLEVRIWLPIIRGERKREKKLGRRVKGLAVRLKPNLLSLIHVNKCLHTFYFNGRSLMSFFDIIYDVIKYTIY